MVVPNTDYCNCHENQSHPEVKDKEQEVPVVFKPKTIVHPRTMVVHNENTGIANRTVMNSCRFYFIAFFTPFSPESLKIWHCLASIP